MRSPSAMGTYAVLALARAVESSGPKVLGRQAPHLVVACYFTFKVEACSVRLGKIPPGRRQRPLWLRRPPLDGDPEDMIGARRSAPSLLLVLEISPAGRQAARSRHAGGLRPRLILREKQARVRPRSRRPPVVPSRGLARGRSRYRLLGKRNFRGAALVPRFGWVVQAESPGPPSLPGVRLEAGSGPARVLVGAARRVRARPNFAACSIWDPYSG
jgi:hypothetical protein